MPTIIGKASTAADTPPPPDEAPADAFINDLVSYALTLQDPRVVATHAAGRAAISSYSSTFVVEPAFAWLIENTGAHDRPQRIAQLAASAETVTN